MKSINEVLSNYPCTIHPSIHPSIQILTFRGRPPKPLRQGDEVDPLHGEHCAVNETEEAERRVIPPAGLPGPVPQTWSSAESAEVQARGTQAKTEAKEEERGDPEIRLLRGQLSEVVRF